MVEQPTARVGTIQGKDGEDDQPNQNNPAGRRIDKMQTKRRRPSGVEVALPKRSTILSCQIEAIDAIMELTHIAAEELGTWDTKANGYTKHLPANTAPACSVLKLKTSLNILAIDPNCKKRTPQANETQSEKKNTTGSVISKSRRAQTSVNK